MSRKQKKRGDAAKAPLDPEAAAVPEPARRPKTALPRIITTTWIDETRLVGDAGPAPADLPLWVALVCMAVAYALGVIVRYEHLGAHLADVNAHLGGVPLPTTLDSFHHGAGVEQALSGVHAGDPTVPTPLASGQVALGALIAAVFGLSVDELMAYLPPLLGPLVVIPLVLLGRLLGSTLWGFAAALAAGIGFSYYTRTSLGYFDTDWAAVGGTLGAATAMSAFLIHVRTRALIAAIALVGITPWFHPGSNHVMLAVVLAFAVYVWIRRRRSPPYWIAVFALAAATLPLAPLLRPLAGMLALFVGHTLVSRPRLLAAAGGALAVGFVAAGGLTQPLGDLVDLLSSGATDPSAPVEFVSVDVAVGELHARGLGVTAERLAGSLPMALLGVVGLALTARRAALLPFLPLLVLGLVLGAISGPRFTVFAVPLIAFGVVGLAFFVARHAARRLRFDARGRTALALSLSLPLLVAALAQALAHHRPPAVPAAEIDWLRALGRRVTPGDFAVAWWDLGYPLRYAAGTRTLIDGGRHRADTFIVAEALAGSSQPGAANLARLAVETQARLSNPRQQAIVHILAEHEAKGLGPSHTLLPRLAAATFTPPPKTREIYFVLPRRFLSIIGVMNSVRQARGLVLVPEKPEVIIYGRRVGGTPVIELSHGWSLDTRTRELRRGQTSIPIERLDRVELSRDGEVTVQSTPGQGQGMRVIWFADNDEILAVGPSLAASLYVQLLVYDNYDRSLFEPVMRNRGGAVFRLLR